MIDKAVDKALDVHIVADNYATHKHPNVQAWLARWDDRKLDHVRPYLAAAEAEGRSGVVAEAEGRSGVVAIVHAQESQWVYSAKNRSAKPGVVSFDFVKEERRVGTYYFYIHDPDFGPGFIKIPTTPVAPGGSLRPW